MKRGAWRRDVSASGLAYPYDAIAIGVLVPVKGIEPSTFSLQVSCSTN